MNSASRLALASLVLLGIAVVLLLRPTAPPPSAARAPLLLYCAAGLKAPVSAVAADYERRFGTRVEIQYGGSGTLLSNLRVSRRGDLFLAADSGYLDLARSNDLVAEVLPVATLRPVLAVVRGNPKGLAGLDDVRRADVALGLAHPDAAAIGRTTRELLARIGAWDAVSARARVFKPTVNDLANDVKLGTLDTAIVWDATVRQYPELEAIPLAAGPEVATEVALGVLKACEQPRHALHFARFLAAPDQGLRRFAEAGFTTLDGDAWAESPEVVLYSGGVNRIAIEETLRAFEEREGVRVTRVYNGCGILTSQIHAGQRPDAYFACDVSFMTNVQALFLPSLELAQTRMVLLTRKGNPRQLRTLEDLGAPGLRLGVANEEQSALGALTARLLRRLGRYDSVMANVVVQTPTADLLVNQMRAGALDAAIVYEANTGQVRDFLDILPLPQPEALAIQPYAVGRTSRHPQLMGRLLAALRSPESRHRFETAGFAWRDLSPAPAP